MSTEDLTREELTSFLNDNYSQEPEQPELPPQSLSMDDWLHSSSSSSSSSFSFDPSRVVLHELEGGLDGMGIVLDNILTRHECKAIIQHTEQIGYGHLGEGKTGRAYRGNCRLQVDDVGRSIMGQELWRRIAPYVREKEEIPDEGSYTYLEMNARYRFAKYYAGQGFAIHVDKPTIYQHDKCSILTVNIYLNDLLPEQGGRTRFFKRMTGGQPVATAGGLAGSVAIFKQSLVPYSPVHDGEKVLSGLKYLMRTDVVYKCVSSSS